MLSARCLPTNILQRLVAHVLNSIIHQRRLLINFRLGTLVTGPKLLLLQHLNIIQIYVLGYALLLAVSVETFV